MRFHRINSQSAFIGIAGSGHVPSLQGVLAAKTVITDEGSDVVACEQELVTIKQAVNEVTARSTFICLMRRNFCQT